MVLHYLLLVSLGTAAAFWLSKQHLLENLQKTEAAKRGCGSPTRLENQLPWGIDRLWQIFRANTESRLMELFLFHFRFWGATLEHRFLGIQAFGTIEPRNIKAILDDDFGDWSLGLRRIAMEPLLGSGIFTQDGKTWKMSKALLRPRFRPAQYDDCKIFREPVNALLHRLSQGGPVVDIQPHVFALSLDLTTAFLFGDSIGSSISCALSDTVQFATAFNAAQDFVATRIRLQDLYWLIDGRRYRNACAIVHSFADQILEKALSIDRKEDRAERYPFLDSLIQVYPDRQTLRSQIINLLVAGRDTTASTITWTFFLLIRHPEVLEKLKQELSTTSLGEDNISRTVLNNMPYLQNVVKEVLRLYPPVPVNSRTASHDTILPVGSGPDSQTPVLVPKGVAVAYSVYSMHRRPDLFGMDAETFRPERWEEAMPLNKDPINKRWGYLPFNGGPRTCLGMDFALTEVAYVVVRILQRFPKLALPANEKVELIGVEKQTITLVMTSTQGCRVNLGEK